MYQYVSIMCNVLFIYIVFIIFLYYYIRYIKFNITLLHWLLQNICYKISARLAMAKKTVTPPCTWKKDKSKDQRKHMLKRLANSQAKTWEGGDGNLR